MENFTITRNGKDQLTLTEKDFHFHCDQIILEISQKLGTEPYQLPDTMDDLEYMQLDEVDELLEHYFTFKFLAREYNLEIPERMHEIEEFITRLLKLAYTY